MSVVAIIILIIIIGLSFTPIIEYYFKDKFPFLSDLKSSNIILIYILTFIEAFLIATIFSPDKVKITGAEPLDIVSYYGTVMTAVGLILTFIETTRSVRSSQSVKNSLIKAVNDYDNQHCMNLLSSLTEDIYSDSYTDAYLNFKIFRKILLKHSGYQKIIKDFDKGPKNIDPSVAPEHAAKVDPSVAPEHAAKVDPSVAPEHAAKVDPSVTPEHAAKVDPSVAPEHNAKVDPSVAPEHAAKVDLLIKTPDLEDKEWLMEYIATKAIGQRIDKLESKLIILAHKGKVSLASIYKTDLINEIMVLRSVVEKEVHTYDSH
ncbi:hypothetical protein ACX1N5_15585 [Acinetobacter sp. ANC 4636]